MTPYQRVKGKDWRMTLPAFGESIADRKRTRHKLEARWDRGVSLGVNVDSTKKIIWTNSTVRPDRCRSVSTRKVSVDQFIGGDAYHL